MNNEEVFGDELSDEMRERITGKLKLKAGTTFGSRIGTATAYSAIYPIGNDNKRVVKIISKPGTINFKDEFENEVRVGRIPGIERVGTKIYESFYEDSFGAYVMDNLLMGNSNSEITTLDMVIYELDGTYSNGRRNLTLGKLDLITYNYIKLLFDFYKITGGWHGDLHEKNVQVITDKYTGAIKRMRVIDYATHTAFKNKRGVEKMTRLGDIVKTIQKEFEAMSPAYGEAMMWNKTKVAHKYINKEKTRSVIGNHVPLMNNPLFLYAVRTGIVDRMNMTVPRPTNEDILRNINMLKNPEPAVRKKWWW
jgi:hypothetical protein